MNSKLKVVIVGGNSDWAKFIKYIKKKSKNCFHIEKRNKKIHNLK